jgi:hypothetical protein
LAFNDFIKIDFIPEGDGKVTSGDTSLPDPAIRDSKESRMSVMFLILETLYEYECDTRMSVENVTVVVKHKNSGGTIYSTQALY